MGKKGDAVVLTEKRTGVIVVGLLLFIAVVIIIGSVEEVMGADYYNPFSGYYRSDSSNSPTAPTDTPALVNQFDAAKPGTWQYANTVAQFSEIINKMGTCLSTTVCAPGTDAEHLKKNLEELSLEARNGFYKALIQYSSWDSANSIIQKLASADAKYVKEFVNQISQTDRGDPTKKWTLADFWKYTEGQGASAKKLSDENKLVIWKSLGSDANTANKLKTDLLNGLMGNPAEVGLYNEIAALSNNVLSKISDAKERGKERDFISQFVANNEQQFRGANRNGKLMSGGDLSKFKLIDFGKDFVKLNDDGSFKINEKTFRIASSADGKPSNVHAFTAEVTAISEGNKGGVLYKNQNYDGNLKPIADSFYTVKDLTDGYMDLDKQFYNKEGKIVGGIHYPVKDATFVVTNNGAETNFAFSASKKVSYKDADVSQLLPYVQTGDSVYTVVDGGKEGAYTVDKNGNVINSKGIGVIVMGENYGKSLDTYYKAKEKATSEKLYSALSNEPTVFVNVGTNPLSIFDGTSAATDSKNYLQLKKGSGALVITGKGVTGVDFVPYAPEKDKSPVKIGYDFQDSKEINIFGALKSDGEGLVGILKVNGEQISSIAGDGRALSASGKEDSSVYGSYEQNWIGINPKEAAQLNPEVADAVGGAIAQEGSGAKDPLPVKPSADPGNPSVTASDVKKPGNKGTVDIPVPTTPSSQSQLSQIGNWAKNPAIGEIQKQLPNYDKSKGNVVVMYSASDCGPCNDFKRDSLPAYQKAGYNVVVLTQPTYKNMNSPVGAIASKAGVDSFPTFITYNPNGQEINRGSNL